MRAAPVATLTFMVTAVVSCAEQPGEALSGAWVEVDGSNFVLLRRTEEAWIVEDEDGRYPAVYDQGVLNVSTGLGGIGEATAVYDSDSETMIFRVGPEEMEFEKAECAGFPTGHYLAAGSQEFHLYFEADCTARGGFGDGDREHRGVYCFRDGVAFLTPSVFLAWFKPTSDRIRLEIKGDTLALGRRTFVREGTPAFDEAVQMHEKARERTREWRMMIIYERLMEDDLYKLVRAQEAYFADRLTYTADKSALDYREAKDAVTVTITSATRNGWAATAIHTRTTQKCGVAVGSATNPVEPAAPEGVAVCR